MQCIPHLWLTYMNKDKLTVGAKLLTNKDINNQTNKFTGSMTDRQGKKYICLKSDTKIIL